MGTSPRELVIDLTKMPEGGRYEDRYGKYLEVFRQIAEFDGYVKVKNPPASWLPLLWYLRCAINGVQEYFQHCSLVYQLLKRGPALDDMLDRTSVEVLCGFRPECVDSLWKIDNQWKIPQGRLQMLPPRKEFIVTCNGSFFRPEVLHYLKEVLPNYQPTKQKVVLVPCAADKPYPAPIHQAVLDRLPEDYYLAIHTGVLGIVPQDLWPVMPHYDSGLPYEWRLMQVAYQYFLRHKHTHVVVYADFYSQTLSDAFMKLGWQQVSNVKWRPPTWAGYRPYVTFVNPVQTYNDYLPLLDPVRLERLEMAFQKEDVTV